MRTLTTTRSQYPLTNEQMFKAAPSIFAARPWEGMSEKYAFIPTIQVVDAMRSEGFMPISAIQSRCRIIGKSDFTMHCIRFRDMRNGDQPAIRALGTVFPELVLTNSHDGKSAYKLDAGLFRLVCTNGMTVAAGNLSQLSVRHSGNPGDVVSISHEIIKEFPTILDSVERFSQLRLEAPQQRAYAEAALQLRYDDSAPITPEVLLRPRRGDDGDATLWNTYNVVQEKLLEGGVRYHQPANREENRRARNGRTRAVTGISENTRLNKALWTLTEKMKDLVS